MGHRIAVMKDGRIQQVGTPLDVYDRPMSAFVAQFIGTPPMNFVSATLSADLTVLEATKFTLPAPVVRRAELASSAGRKVLVGIRPENIFPAQEEGRGQTARLRGLVEIVEPIGHEAIVHIRAGDDLLVASFDAHVMPRMGESIEFGIELDALHLFDAVTERRLTS